MSGQILNSITGRLIAALALLPLAYATLAQGQSAQASASSAPPEAQSQSMADAARRSRDQAKSATKPSKVITDDDLDKTNIKPGAQGLTVDAPAKLETQSPTPDAVAAAATTATPSNDPATSPTSSDDPEIAKLKTSIAEAEKDADISRRELTLHQDTYLSNPDHEHDAAGKAKADTLQQEINTRQQDIDRMKLRLAALQELRHTPPAAPAVNQPGGNSATSAAQPTAKP